MLLEAKLFSFNHHPKFLHNRVCSALHHRMLFRGPGGGLESNWNDSPWNPKVCPSYLPTKGRVANWPSLEQFTEPKYSLHFLESRLCIFSGWHLEPQCRTGVTLPPLFFGLLHDRASWAGPITGYVLLTPGWCNQSSWQRADRGDGCLPWHPTSTALVKDHSFGTRDNEELHAFNWGFCYTSAVKGGQLKVEIVWVADSQVPKSLNTRSYLNNS